LVKADWSVAREIRDLSGGAWYYRPDYRQLCQVIGAQTLWGETTCRVWLPGRDSVVRIPVFRLKSLESAGTGSPDNVAYIAAPARVADTLTQDVLLVSIESPSSRFRARAESLVAASSTSIFSVACWTSTSSC
jgi:hypothetical protein